nr:hypothetical protein [Streptomyces kanamyceticus]
MADDADAAVPFAQRVQDVQDLVERLVVEAAEPLVDEEGGTGSSAVRHTISELGK